MANRSQLEAESFTKILARFTFLLAFCLLCSTSAENYNADYEYEDYGDYKPLYDGNDYVDLDPGIDDYYDTEQVQSRSKKDVDPMLDMGWLHKSVVNLAEPVCEPVTNTTVASVTETTTECDASNWTRACAIVQAISQTRVQLEASEIKKVQAIANEAQQELEESANHVRAVTAALQNAQQEVASSAIRVQTAQVQLAAHDQLLFAARQDVDALSSQMVGPQAAEGIAQPKATFDKGALMKKLRQPLLEAERPTPVPTIAQNSPLTKKKSPSDFYYDDEYVDY